jgi:hypothetical protein
MHIVSIGIQLDVTDLNPEYPYPRRQCYGRTDRTILATGYKTTQLHRHKNAITTANHAV